MNIGITGPRPVKLWGYDYSDRRWQYLKSYIKNRLLQLNCKRFYTGMALGVDTVGAQAVLELKEEGHDIKLVAIIPCAGQSNKWPMESKMLYYDILSNADEIYGTADTTPTCAIKLRLSGDADNPRFYLADNNPSYEYMVSYYPEIMQKRNILVVDSVDKLLAVWNGTSGGTANCVSYARSCFKDIEIINPDYIQ